jgi:site-specific DNA recombinase
MKPRKPALQVRSTTRRCAIYTRKSSEEGLEQAFNSLDAQREACEAYIRSQRHEGWILVPTLYDDGGISGGTLERPALQQLLNDIAAGKVNLVVVYKVDRLTRSLADFAKIVDVFDAHDASFVSVTQQFNTSTSMGRLTLNMLLSFAQFEREVTGERIRDKIAASKRKGMWMGGNVPLGYEVQDRKLVIAEVEAETIRHIFRSYLALGSVRLLKEQLTTEGVTRRSRAGTSSSPDNAANPSRVPISRGALYVTLQNRLYRGEVHHNGTFYPGEHQAIIEPDLWDAVQAQLATNRTERQSATRSAHPSLLTGLVHDHQGQRMIPTHASKDHRRYRYYVSASLQIDGASKTADGLRVPATDLEQIVTGRLLSFLRQRAEVFAAVKQMVSDGNAQRLMLEQAARIAEGWTKQSTLDRRILLQSLVARIELATDAVDVHLAPAALIDVLLPGRRTATDQHIDLPSIVLSAAVQLMRWKKEVRLLIKSAAGETEPNPALIRLITKAHGLWAKLLTEQLTITALAEREGVTSSYVTRLVRLACLAPDIIVAILSGQQPKDLTADKLLVDSRLPLGWAEQRSALGFG